jgi:signal transduction histidine kinase
MILAVSRFRVANGLEGEIREAFLNRPHLVDSASGFLGMETFTDAGDRSLFYLVTGWTDVESFRAWHRSDAHHLSHAGIPRGLKLDPRYTEVVVLDRLQPATEPTLPDLITDATLLVRDFLSKTKAIYYISVSDAGTIRACNDPFAVRVRVKTADLISQPIRKYLGINEGDVLQTHLANGASARGERVLLNFRDIDEAPFTLECQLEPQRGGFILLGEPLVEREQLLQEQLFAMNNEWAVVARERAQLLGYARVAQEEAEAATQARDTMLSIVSHDLRTPLGAIINAVHLLRESALPGPTAAQALNIIDRNARLQHRLVDDLLDVGRIVSGGLDIRSQPVALTSVIEIVVESLRHEAEAKRITVTSSIDKPVDHVQGDPERLQQLLGNLVANAIKFTPKGGVVDVRLTTTGDHARIIVSDNGIGISAESLPHVFDRFRRGVSGSYSRKTGLGLGLFIAEELARLHGGSLRAESAGPGLGATFIVELPLIATYRERSADEVA